MPFKPPLWERVISAFLIPLRFLSSLSSWVEWALDRIIIVPVTALSEMSIWFVWAFERTLLAPWRAISRLATWIGRNRNRKSQMDEGFKPFWQRVLLRSCILATRPPYFIWRMLSSPFRRRIDE